MSDTLVVSHSHRADSESHRSKIVRFVDSAMRADGRCLGFLTTQAIRGAYDAGRTVTLYRNGDRVGYATWSLNSSRECRILQIWVRPDARMIEHGRAIISEIEQRIAKPHRCWVIRCWVAEDLAANIFWPAIGFAKKGWRWGKGNSPRRHNLWWLSLQGRSTQSQTGATPPHAGECGTTNGRLVLPAQPTATYTNTLVRLPDATKREMTAALGRDLAPLAQFSVANDGGLS